MKKLKNKVFLSIFSIISIFLIIGIVIYNFQNYKKEYDNIYRNLNFIDDFKLFNNANKYSPDQMDIDNAMIINYEVYTVRMLNNRIARIIGHSNSDSDFDVERVALDILNGDKDFKIGNLYNNKYAYNFKTNDMLVIINTENINKRLTITLVESIMIFLLLEAVIYFVSLLITKWITKPAEESFKKQKDFIADASHELKTPLAVIMASSDELKSDKKNIKYVDNIKYEAERMSKLISGLLDLSKLENGILINSYIEENVYKIIEKICLTFEAIAFEENVSIETNIEKDLTLKCSKEDIEKLISIILDNAIKHSYKDKTIFVNAYKEKNSINIEITNEGDPIKVGDEEKIFERFYRTDKSRNRESNRYGLGLAIAKNIVVNHNGTIKAYSINGKTTFKINFKNKNII